MSAESRFTALLQSRRAEALEEAPVLTKPVAVPSPVVETESQPEPVKQPRGRPGGHGKRNNPAYTQVTAYIPEDLHVRTKINLLRTGKREFSDLIEELLMEWNRRQAETHAI